MIHLIIGGASSGKSEVAESVCLALSNRAAYVATMEPFGRQAQNRIQRHLDLRAGKGLATIEQYRDIKKLMPESDKYDTLLIECMTNLTANELFGSSGEMVQTDVSAKITGEVEQLSKVFRNLVIVTCDVFGDGRTYSKETQTYMRTLGKLNQQLARQADQVTEVYFGIRIPQKSTIEGGHAHDDAVT